MQFIPLKNGQFAFKINTMNYGEVYLDYTTEYLYKVVENKVIKIGTAKQKNKER